MCCLVFAVCWLWCVVCCVLIVGWRRLLFVGCCVLPAVCCVLFVDCRLLCVVGCLLRVVLCAMFGVLWVLFAVCCVIVGWRVLCRLEFVCLRACLFVCCLLCVGC